MTGKNSTLALEPMNNGSSIVARVTVGFQVEHDGSAAPPVLWKENALSGFSSVAFPATPVAARQKPPLYCPPRQGLGTSSESALNPPTLSADDANGVTEPPKRENREIARIDEAEARGREVSRRGVAGAQEGGHAEHTPVRLRFTRLIATLLLMSEHATRSFRD
jgi:hypothetical protein